MVSGWLLLILALNLGISFWNARVCGLAWAESKALGGFIRLLVWCGVVQSVVGFSSVFMLPLVFLAHWALPDHFTALHVRGALSLWYITVIFPALGTGLIIMIQSWITAYRERDMLSMGAAAWNTFAQLHNTYGAVKGLGPALSSVGEMLSGALRSDDEESNPLAMLGVVLAVGIVLCSLLAGAFLTAAIIHHYAGTLPVPERRAAVARARA